LGPGGMPPFSRCRAFGGGRPFSLRTWQSARFRRAAAYGAR
jgi:hypothetical protein